MVLLALSFMGAVLAAAVAAAPAPAQTAGGDPPDFVLEEDGTVVIDGDGATDCPSFAVFLERGELGGNPEQARSVLEQCRQAGFLPSGGSAPVSPTPQPPSAQVSEQRQQQPSPARAALPSTGGPDLPMPAPMGGALLVGLVALGLAAQRRRSP